MVYLKGGRALMSQPVARPTIQQFRRDFRLTSEAEENKARMGHGSITAGLSAKWPVRGWEAVWPVTAFYTYPEPAPSYTNKINTLTWSSPTV